MATVNRTILIELAARQGVIEDTPAARANYEGWLERNPVAAQRAIMPALRAKASLSPTPRSEATEPAYNTSWLRTIKAARRSGVSARSRSRANVPAQATRITPNRQQPVSFVAAQAARHDAELQRMHEVQRRNAVSIGARS